MTRQKKVAYLVGVIMIVLIGVIFGIGGYLYQTSNRLTTYRINTQVANVHVGGLFANEAQEIITKEALQWRNQANVRLIYQGYTIDIDPNTFSIDVRSTMRQIRDGQTIPLVVNLKDDRKHYLNNIITQHEDVLKYGDFNIEKLEIDLLSQVGMLRNLIQIDLGNYIQNLPQNRTKIAETSIIGVDPNIFDTIDIYFGGRIEITIESGEFSLIEWMRQTTLEETDEPNAPLLFSDEQLSALGTGVYELILHTNFINIQKSITKDPEKVPSYIYHRPGFETRIDTDNNVDFTFYNPNPMPYTVTVTRVDNALSFSLLGVPFIDTIEVIGAEDVEVLPFGLIINYAESYRDVPIEIGQPLTTYSGKEGKSVIIQRRITTHDGTVYTIRMNEDIYQPIAKRMIYHPDDQVNQPMATGGVNG